MNHRSDLHPSQEFFLFTTIRLVSCYRQIVTSSPPDHFVLYSVVIHLIASPTGSCALGIVFRLNITYCGTSLLSASSVNITVTGIYSLPDVFITTDFAPTS
jgi:hypothetical protein